MSKQIFSLSLQVRRANRENSKIPVCKLVLLIYHSYCLETDTGYDNHRTMYRFLGNENLLAAILKEQSLYELKDVSTCF